MNDLLSIYKLQAFWIGCAAARDDESVKAVYTRIAKQLDAGVDPATIPEIKAWLARRRVMLPAGRA